MLGIAPAREGTTEVERKGTCGKKRHMRTGTGCEDSCMGRLSRRDDGTMQRRHQANSRVVVAACLISSYVHE